MTLENLKITPGRMGWPWTKVQLLQHQAHHHIKRNVSQIGHFLSSESA